MCLICGRGNCCPMFHSTEEQAAFSEAVEAWERFLEIRERCAIEYQAQEANENA